MSFRDLYSFRRYRGLKSEVVEDFSQKVAFLKKDPLRENLQKFVSKGFTASQIHVLCANFVKFGRPEVGEIARCLPAKKNFGSLRRSRFCADRSKNLPEPAPVNVLGVPQTSSKSVHFRWSYSRTREHRSNAPQSVSNTRRSFFAE